MVILEMDYKNENLIWFNNIKYLLFIYAKYFAKLFYFDVIIIIIIIMFVVLNLIYIIIIILY